MDRLFASFEKSTIHEMTRINTNNTKPTAETQRKRRGKTRSNFSLHASRFLFISLRACRRLHSVPSSAAFDAGTWLPSPSTESRSEEHTSELQSLRHLVCRLLLEKKN